MLLTRFINLTALRSIGQATHKLHRSVMHCRKSNDEWKFCHVPDDVPPETSTAKETIENLLPEQLKRLKVLKLEYDVWQEMGHKLPDEMTDEMWVEILKCPTQSQRRRIYSYYFSVETTENALKRKKAERRAELDQVERRTPMNSFYFFIRQQTINKVENSRIAQAMQFELPLVFDLGYEQYMRQEESINLMTQILMAHGLNKASLTPFHFLFTDAESGNVINAFYKNSFLPTAPTDDRMFTVTQKSYLDIFPKNKLIYLTPNASNYMRRFDHDKVYILGAFNDKSCPKPISMARAKEHGIAMERLPLESFLRWGCGNKSLTLNQMVAILLELKRTGDWYAALKHVPSRKLMTQGENPQWGGYTRSPLVMHHTT